MLNSDLLPRLTTVKNPCIIPKILEPVAFVAGVSKNLHEGIETGRECKKKHTKEMKLGDLLGCKFPVKVIPLK